MAAPRRPGRRPASRLVDPASRLVGPAIPLWTRLGLRARVTVIFGLGALLLSVGLGCLSFFTIRHVLVGERESAALHQAYTNAQNVRTYVQGGAPIDQILSTADSGTTGSHSHSVLDLHGKWYARTLSVARSAIPASLQIVVRSGTAGTQTYVSNGDPEIAVGVPIPAIGAAYYEVFDLTDLAHTLRVLALALFGAGLVTTVFGAVLGRWASGRSLRPLTGVSKAAVAIAGGQLDTRLAETSGDPDLAGLTGSFNRMVDQLQERIEREVRFTSDVSHELRSPLTTLAASVAVIEARAEELTPSGRRALELLSADLRRFQRMVGDLLEMSRSDTGSADVPLEEVDPAELVRHAVAAALRSLPPVLPGAARESPAGPGAGGGAGGLEVQVSPEVAGTRLSVDKRRFERVMTNLLENAAIYGGGATVVRVDAGPPVNGHPRSVRVSIEDAGPGLPPAERSRVFERFYRGQAAFRRGAGTGTGLGLALVAEHVRLHGGKVWAEEAEGGGARFTVELPADLAEPEGEGDDAAGIGAGAGSRPGRPE